MIRRIPIRWRLTLAFTLAMAAVLGSVGLVLHLNLERTLDHSVDDSLVARAAEVAAVVTTRGGDVTSVTVGSEAGESLAQLLDDRGRVLQSSPGAPAGALVDEKSQRRALAGAAVWTSRRIDPATHRFRLLSRRLDTADGARVLVVATSLADRDEAIDQLSLVLAIAGPLALVVASALGALLAALTLRPVEAMRRKAAVISGEQPGGRLPVAPTRDEIQRLGETLNAMLARIDGALRHERSFVADASHELRTPIAILRAEIDLALAGSRSPAELRAALASAGEETDRLARLASDLLVLARADDGELPVRAGDVSARTMLDEIAAPLRARGGAAGREIAVDAPQDLVLHADRARIEQALGNLVDNALIHGAGTIRLSARPVQGGAEIAVTDEGPGFPPEFAPRAFDRFARADSSRRTPGTGLGLAIVRAVAQAHGGEAYLGESGSDVRIRLPDGPRAR